MNEIERKAAHNAWKREWRKNNPEKVKASNKRNNAKYQKSELGYQARKRARNMRRAFIIEFFGGACLHCGFSDPRALQMDHIHGRQGEKRLGNIDSRYRWVRDNPEEAREKYQLLCANCNFIKREENGEHYYHGRDQGNNH